MSAINIYEPKKIIELWKKSYYNFESFDFDYYSDKESLDSEFTRLSEYFSIPILALKKENEELYNSVKQISDIFDKPEYKYSPVKSTDVENIENNLNIIDEYFSSIANVDFFIELSKEYKQSLLLSEANYSASMKNNEEKAKEKINEVLGGYSINQIDYAFAEQYNEIKISLAIKQAVFYIVCIISPFWLIDVLKSFPQGLENIALRIIIFLPLVWLFIILYSQIKEDRRTAQSYLHKSVVAKSYVNYARTLNDKIFENDLALKQELVTLLLKTSVDILKDDPVNLWDKGKSDKNETNMQVIIEKLIDKIPTK